MLIKKILLVLMFLPLSRFLPADEIAPAPVKTAEEKQLDTLRFGTETEIAALIQTLKNENASHLDEELIEIAKKTKNRAILSGVFRYFGEAEKSGLEERAITVVQERDDEANETVLTAVDYLGKVKAAEAIDSLEELINSGENRFLSSAFRALGRAASKTDTEEAPGGQNSPEQPGGENTADRTALFLLDYYKNRLNGDEFRRDIISALGETGSKESVDFLSGIAKNAEERPALKMAAIEALAKVGDNSGLEAVIASISSSDPNIRSSAVAALGPFSGEVVDNAILDAFRDSYYRTRIGAAAAAGKRRLESAVPYLRYRAENDEVPAVRDEAIKALGAINNGEAMGILDLLFTERKNSDRTRLIAAEMLIKNDAAKYGSKVFLEMEEAKSKNQTALYNGFVRVMVPARSPALEDLARRFAAGSGVIEKSLALDLILNNEFRSLEDLLRDFLDEKRHSAAIARKAQSTIEKLGL